MSSKAHFLRLLTPVVRNERELLWYVLQVVAGCVAVALIADAVNQYFTASSLGDAIRALSVTFLLATVIAFVAAGVAGRAHLELYRAKTEMEIASRTDSLTGLPNRRAFFAAADAVPVEAIVLLIADIDRFKRINDTRGHLVGDEILRAVGRQMASELTDLGHLGRVGGEEFAMIVADRPLADIVARIETFRERLASTPIVCRGERVSVTISVGVAVGAPGMTFETLYAEADRALYAAKRGGRNVLRIASVDPPMDRDLLNWLDEAADRPSLTARKAG
jgi:diguanylate cyclase (GGDEF)-like protein